METRANYVLVGSFVLAGFLGIIIFLVWLSKTSLGESVKLYDIYFKGNVTGLKKDSSVQYRGVPVGTVKSIRIDRKNVENIRVRVAIESRVELHQDVVATLEMQGLTGVPFVQIKGGTTSSPLLVAKEGQRYPVIEAKSSLLEEVAGSVPELLAATNKLLHEIQGFLTKENRDSFSKIIKNMESITDYLSPKNKKESAIIAINQAANSIDKAMKELHTMLHENRPGFKDFSGSGLDSFTKFLNEGRDTLNSIKRVSESLERSPSRFFYNDPKQGVRPQ